MSSPSAAENHLYATCAAGLQTMLADELRALGATGVNTAGAGVRFGGGLPAAYKACLWSRIANRVLLPIHTGAADSPEALYDVVQQVDWSEHMALDGTLAVDFFTANSTITHSQYGALKVKDAIVDQFRERTGDRPNVERDQPSLRVNVYLFRNKARIAIDLSGSSLHRRGYREQAGPAPLKENLAAALLLACDWPALATQGLPFADPLCGSGTLVIEAAMIACNQAPGLHRDYFGFTGWLKHDSELWNSIYQKALDARHASTCKIVGADKSGSAIAVAIDNAVLAKVGDAVSFKQRGAQDGSLLSSGESGLLLSNPPYGERLSIADDFYAQLGTLLSTHYAGWQCGLFTATETSIRDLRLPMKPEMQVINGGIECTLYRGDVPAIRRHRSPVAAVTATVPDAGSAADSADSGMSSEAGTAHQNADTDSGAGAADSIWAAASKRTTASKAASNNATNGSNTTASAHAVDATPFANRLRKNGKALKSWLKREGINAYRLYDADLPEFAVAIDVYNCVDVRHVVVQEYQAPATVNVVMAEARLAALMQQIPEILSVDSDNVYLKVRQKQAGNAQYQAQRDKAANVWSRNKDAAIEFEEQASLYELNFTDYIDTGLFLDHRKVRRHIRDIAQGKQFLNLFAYTGAATVDAIAGGAAASVSVDLSNRYCQWMQRNIQRNCSGAAKHASQADAHEVVRSDVGTWLKESPERMFDLILLDPPTFSNSTDLDDDWNVQRDHKSFIELTMSRLADDGLLIFSNNYRRFKLDMALSEKNGGRFQIEDKSHWSIDKDFQRNSRIHQCWFIKHA